VAGATKVKVLGAERLERTLKEAGKSLDEMKALHAAVGELIADEGRPNVSSVSGALEGSIRASGTKAAAVVRAGGGSVPYAGVQEFGWPARNIPAQGFLTGSLADNEENIVSLYQDEVDQLLGKVKGQ
jgi:phage gpG-like protein